MFEATQNRYLLVCLSHSPDFNKASHFSRAIQVFTWNRTMAQWFFFPLFSNLPFFFLQKCFFFSCNLKHRKRGDSTFSSLHRRREKNTYKPSNEMACIWIMKRRRYCAQFKKKRAQQKHANTSMNVLVFGHCLCVNVCNRRFEFWRW